MSLYEILVPGATNSGRRIEKKFHCEWHNRVRRITGGLTIVASAKGQWTSPDGSICAEDTILVRVAATPKQMNQIARMTAEYYSQEAVMYYKISDEVKVYHA